MVGIRFPDDCGSNSGHVVVALEEGVDFFNQNSLEHVFAERTPSHRLAFLAHYLHNEQIGPSSDLLVWRLFTYGKEKKNKIPLEYDANNDVPHG